MAVAIAANKRREHIGKSVPGRHGDTVHIYKILHCSKMIVGSREAEKEELKRKLSEKESFHPTLVKRESEYDKV